MKDTWRKSLLGRKNNEGSEVRVGVGCMKDSKKAQCGHSRMIEGEARAVLLREIAWCWVT